MENQYRFLSGEVKTLSQDKEKNLLVEIQLLNAKVNANNWQFTNIENHLRDFADTPLLYSVRNGKIANGHDFKIVEDKETGEKYPSFIDGDSEHLAGWIFEKDGDKLNPHIENIDGTDWVVAKALIPRHYNREFEKEFKENGNKMSISIEAIVTKFHEENGVEVEDEYNVVGTTILGKGVQPAVASANLRKLSVNSEQLDELKLRVASVIETLDNKKFVGVGEPQLNTAQTKIKKGDSNTKMLKIEELTNKFPSLKVLSADESGNVALLNETNGELHLSSATMGENGEIVVGEIKNADVSMLFKDGEKTIEVPFEQIKQRYCSEIDSLNEKLKTSQEQLTNKDNALTTALSSLKAMQDAEFERRKVAVVEAVKARFNSFNANRTNKLSEDIFACLITDEKVNDFAKCVDEKGCFIGEQKICQELDTICVNAVMAEDKQNAENKQNELVLNSIVNSPVVESGLDALTKGYGD